MTFHTTKLFAGRPLVIGQTVLTATERGGITWAKLTYIELDQNGNEVPIFSVHFTAYPIPLEFVESPTRLGPGKWCFTPKLSGG